MARPQLRGARGAWRCSPVGPTPAGQRPQAVRSGSRSPLRAGRFLPTVTAPSSPMSERMLPTSRHSSAPRTNDLARATALRFPQKKTTYLSPECNVITSIIRKRYWLSIGLGKMSRRLVNWGMSGGRDVDRLSSRLSFAASAERTDRHQAITRSRMSACAWRNCTCIVDAFKSKEKQRSLARGMFQSPRKWRELPSLRMRMSRMHFDTINSKCHLWACEFHGQAGSTAPAVPQRLDSDREYTRGQTACVGAPDRSIL